MLDMHKHSRIVAAALGLVLLGGLIWPESPPAPLSLADSAPFTWDRANLFRTLEQQFASARASSLEATEQQTNALTQQGRQLLAEIERSGATVPFELLADLESIQFHLAALAAAHEPLLHEAAALMKTVRITVMRAARAWPIDRPGVHEAIYRVIYGGRTALEEALVQHRSDALPPLVAIEDVSSAAPSAVVNGVTVHSGDIVLSRGGAPTSALIARGNDFPGHFSHAALVHVDAETGVVTVIESLIEHGVVLTTLDRYLEDKKLRMLLLRPRPEHPVLAKDPQAPHRAVTAMLARARAQRIPYDFAMDWNDATAFFCSEVPYHAYQSIGVDLWSSVSHLSSPGLVAWLNSLGVQHFVTIVPSDLEYDPDLAAVAEWRNPETLRQDRFDNATMDALLEGADRGDRLGYAWYHLPMARVVKTWSILQEPLGFKPMIPEGINASIALRVDSLSKKVHPVARQAIEQAAIRFKESNSYEPPYWSLIDLARQAVMEHREKLAPALKPARAIIPMPQKGALT